MQGKGATVVFDSLSRAEQSHDENDVSMWDQGARKGTPLPYDGLSGLSSCMVGASPCGRPGKPMRIAVFRALQLGDMLVAVPAFRKLRRCFPYAEITLIGLPWAALFAQRFSRYIDRFVEFEGYPGIDEVPVDPQRVEHFIAEQRAYGYDVAIQMHGSGRTSNPFVLALGSSVTVGYYEKRDPHLTYGAFYPNELHEIERNLNLVALLNNDTITTEKDTRLEFPLFADDYVEADELLRPLKRENLRFIAIHPGARPPARRWPTGYFALVADRLAQHFDAQILLTGSAGEEQTVQAVLGAMQAPAFSLVGKTSLGSLAALMTKLDLFISNDTGPAHMACAVDCSSVTIFGPADVRRWAPLDAKKHPIVRHPVACSPCGYWECPIDHRCLHRLLPETVIATAIHVRQAGMQGAATP